MLDELMYLKDLVYKRQKKNKDNSYWLNSASPQMHMFNLNPHCDSIWRWEAIRSWGQGPHEWDQCLYNKFWRAPLPLPPCEIREKRFGFGIWLSPNTGSSSTMILDSQSPELWEVNFCCLQTTWYLVFCYNSPRRLDSSFFFFPNKRRPGIWLKEVGKSVLDLVCFTSILCLFWKSVFLCTQCPYL